MTNLAGEKPLCQHERLHTVMFVLCLCPEGSRAQALSVSEMSLLWPYTRYSNIYQLSQHIPCQGYNKVLASSGGENTGPTASSERGRNSVSCLAPGTEGAPQVDALVQLRSACIGMVRTSARVTGISARRADSLLNRPAGRRELTGLLENYKDEEQVKTFQVDMTLMGLLMR